MFRSDFLTQYFRIIIILLLVIILGGSWHFFLGPKFEMLRVEIGNLEKEKNILILKEDRLEELKRITRDYKEIEEEKIKKIKSVLPSEKDLPGIFVQMEALAEENGFILSSIEIVSGQKPKIESQNLEKEGRLAKEKTIQEIGVTLKLEGGSYEKFKNFLSEVEKNLRILDVTSVSFDSKGTSFGINLKTYYL